MKTVTKVCNICKRSYPLGTINYDLVESTGLCLDCAIEEEMNNVDD